MSGSNQFGGAVKVTVDGSAECLGPHGEGGRRDLRPGQELDGGRRAARWPSLRRRRQGADHDRRGGGRGGRRRDRQYVGQRARHRRPARRRGRKQSPQRRVAGAEPLRQSRQPDLGPCRHRGRRAQRPQPAGPGRPRHCQHRHAHQPRGLDHRHHGQHHDRRGWLGALPDRDRARAAVEPELQRGARHGQGSAGLRQHPDQCRQPGDIAGARRSSRTCRSPPFPTPTPRACSAASRRSCLARSIADGAQGAVRSRACSHRGAERRRCPGRHGQPPGDPALHRQAGRSGAARDAVRGGAVGAVQERPAAGRHRDRVATRASARSSRRCCPTIPG